MFNKEHPEKIVGEKFFAEFVKNFRNDDHLQKYHNIENKNNNLLIRIVKLRKLKEEEKRKINEESIVHSCLSERSVSCFSFSL